MRTMRFTTLALATALALAGRGVAAQDGLTITTTEYAQEAAEEYEGSQFRPLLAQALELRRDSTAKWAKLAPALAFCDGKQDTPTQRWVAVTTAAEHDEIVATRGSEAAKPAFVDIVCPRAYTMAGFFAVDDGDIAKAIAYLERAQALAPFASEAHSERGFIHNAAGERDQALAAYRRALAITERYPAAPDDQAVALRGIGWTLIELGDYAGAKDAYTRALQVEPGHRGAQQELAYIEKLLAGEGEPPATPVFDTRLAGGKADDKPAAPTPAGATSAANDAGDVAAAGETGTPAVAGAADDADAGTAAGVSTPAQKDAVLERIRQLEEAPFHADAKAVRSALIDWITEAPDVQVTVCLGHGLIGAAEEGTHDSLLFVQSLFGMAAYAIRHPDADPLGVPAQRAGLESLLRAYASILRDDPDARVPALDERADRLAAGDLDAFIAEQIAADCHR